MLWHHASIPAKYMGKNKSLWATPTPSIVVLFPTVPRRRQRPLVRKRYVRRCLGADHITTVRRQKGDEDLVCIGDFDPLGSVRGLEKTSSSVSLVFSFVFILQQ